MLSSTLRLRDPEHLLLSLRQAFPSLLVLDILSLSLLVTSHNLLNLSSPFFINGKIGDGRETGWLKEGCLREGGGEVVFFSIPRSHFSNPLS